MFYTLKKFDDPPTGFKASKTSGWTADSFSGGLEITFTEAPAGTKAVLCTVVQDTTLAYVFQRKSGDTNISNTPAASQEYSHFILDQTVGLVHVLLWLSSDLKVQIAVSNTGQDIYVSYPIVYLS